MFKIKKMFTKLDLFKTKIPKFIYEYYFHGNIHKLINYFVTKREMEKEYENKVIEIKKIADNLININILANFLLYSRFNSTDVEKIVDDVIISEFLINGKITKIADYNGFKYKLISEDGLYFKEYYEYIINNTGYLLIPLKDGRFLHIIYTN